MLWGPAGDFLLPSVIAGRNPTYGDGLPRGPSMKEMAHGDRQDLSDRSPVPAQGYVAGDRHGMTLQPGKREPFRTSRGMRRSVRILGSYA